LFHKDYRLILLLFYRNQTTEPMNFRKYTILAILSLIFFSSCKPPRCPLASCHVRMKHRHGEAEFRGVPWWKKNKDPKIGQDYQDPNAKDAKKNQQSAKARKKEVIQKKKDSQRQ